MTTLLDVVSFVGAESRNLNEYLKQNMGTTLILPFPYGWRVTITNENSIKDVIPQDIQILTQLYICCEKSLKLIGIVHHHTQSKNFGPVLFRGGSGNMYMFNPYSDMSMYHVAKSLYDFFIHVGLRHFYPVYDYCEYLSESGLVNCLLRHAVSTESIVLFRDLHLNAGFVLKTKPFLTFIKIENKLPESRLYKWYDEIKDEYFIIFTAMFNYKKWKKMYIVTNMCGQLFAIGKDRLILLADDMAMFLKIGCFRVTENTRFTAGWYLQSDKDFNKCLKPKCPRGICLRNFKFLCCVR
ncbi:hypothetical protein MRV_0041 [Murid herpesvirus 3]|uniref:Tegument protein UL43 n=2 Tax=Murid betaherpesvirus 3 TaxID=2560603 RepID=A0A1P8VIT7_9BETA|nr:hypothetical protein MRV_0041 [Murine roseolovirus]APZ76252.1 hypothetical protein MRV_0041 [Murid betaherpesvirus 3]AYH64768.1 hypothetical protein MRV_0041 [Murid herpesvirus 3]